MPIHLGGWLENQDPAGAFAFVAALDDPLGLDDGDDLIVPDVNQIIALASGVPSGGGQRARIDSPSIRVLGRLELTGFNGGADADAEPDSPQQVVDYRLSPLILEANERATLELDYNTTLVEAGWVLLWLADRPPEPVTGRRMHSVRVTTTVTLVINAWSNTPLTFADALPVGRYAVVGARFQSAGLVAARFVFRDSPWRPGVLCVDDENDQQHPMFRFGGLGILGEFESIAPPTVDFLAISADANPTGVLDVVQVRAGRG